MLRREDIPEIAICHVCGQPMKIIDVSALAKSLGYTVRSGSYALECCGFEQTIEDPELAKHVLTLLLEYHSQTPMGGPSV
jgi:hypothetical protein